MTLSDVFYTIGTRVTETGRQCTGLANIDIEQLPEAKALIEKPQNMKDAFQSILIRQALQINYDPIAEIDTIIEVIRARFCQLYQHESFVTRIIPFLACESR